MLEGRLFERFGRVLNVAADFAECNFAEVERKRSADAGDGEELVRLLASGEEDRERELGRFDLR